MQNLRKLRKILEKKMQNLGKFVLRARARQVLLLNLHYIYSEMILWVLCGFRKVVSFAKMVRILAKTVEL